MKPTSEQLYGKAKIRDLRIAKREQQKAYEAYCTLHNQPIKDVSRTALERAHRQAARAAERVRAIKATFKVPNN